MNGADTETHKGYCRLICIENHPHLYIPVINQWESLTNYLLDAPAKICFYNLRFDVEAILKHYPEEFIKNLLYLTEAEIQFKDKIWTFKLIPWKVFTIREMVLEKNRRRTKRIVQCFDTAQFYHASLQDAANRTLHKSKTEDKEFAEKLNTSIEPWNNELERIISYCQEDAVLSGELMRTFVQSAASEPINLAPKNPISCAWYAKELIRQCIPEVKSIKSIRTGQGFYYSRPWKRLDNVGAQCYFGGRFEVVSKGVFDNPYVYDINSAYPHWISQLPNPYNLHFVKDYEPEGDWSMVKAEVWVPEDLHIGPLPYRTSESIIFPLGNWVGWFHWHELKNAAEKFGVEFQIQKALNGYEPEGIQRPFAERIPMLYDYRQSFKKMNDPRELPTKIAMNSTYGVFYEKNDRIEETNNSRATEIDGHLLSKKKDNPGRFFHPFIAGWPTSKTRVQLLNAIHIDSLIFTATDGILSEKKLNLPCSKKMGEWSETQYEQARVFGNGLYELDGVMKTRGFKKDKDKDKRPMIERMMETPEGIMIETIEKGPIHLNQAFRLKNYSLKDALVWVQREPKYTNITQCHKRIWPHFTKDDLYATQIRSKPKIVDDGKLNHNPGLVWKGDSGNNISVSDRFILGKIQVENHS